ncbi:alpha/beta fold hydrolase [Streptomyces shenzhenensis]|uniref:alpha/beta fold hydrolase n=1 Tax=Streptomyces shenzhenensis TaxID=943815 RepID=UPI003D907B31
MIHAQYLQVDGVLSFVLTEGDPSAPAVVCLHTAGQNGVQWRHVQSELAARGWYVVVPDLPGHGKSEPHPDGPVRDLGDYAAWCEHLIDTLELETPYIVGCSIGGRIAIDLAVRRSHRLSGVVAMAAHGGSDTVDAGLDVQSLERELIDAAAPSRSDRTYLGTHAVLGPSVPQAQRETIALMHRREDPEVSNSDLIGWVSHDVFAGLSSIRCPVHVVIGEADLWLTPDAGRRTAAEISRARFTLLPGIGHYPMEELQDGAGQVDAWLRDLEGTA